MADGYQSLTEKERETLRLILHGHDAKSMARELGLSVHTINERLRAARHKLGVTSSKEAARLLFEREADDPQFLGHKQLGDAGWGAEPAQSEQSQDQRKAWMSRAPVFGGLLIMSLVFATLALGLLPGVTNGYQPAEATRPAELEEAARRWLELMDAGDAEASYALTSASFREETSLEGWTEAMRNVRGSLGATLSRELLSVDALPTPEGYSLIRFRTTFENLQGADLDPKEVVTLVEEDGEWRVVGLRWE